MFGCAPHIRRGGVLFCCRWICPPKRTTFSSTQPTRRGRAGSLDLSEEKRSARHFLVRRALRRGAPAANMRATLAKTVNRICIVLRKRGCSNPLRRKMPSPDTQKRRIVSSPSGEQDFGVPVLHLSTGRTEKKKSSSTKLYIGQTSPEIGRRIPTQKSECP